MNAIILAAGKSNRFAPFTYEKPKGLFRVKGEILIERQIEQLQQAGVSEIYIVVGYMKEKFFYLEQKYGVKLIVNNEFGKKGNLYSLYVTREHFNNTFICAVSCNRCDKKDKSLLGRTKRCINLAAIMGFC